MTDKVKSEEDTKFNYVDLLFTEEGIKVLAEMMGQSIDVEIGILDKEEADKQIKKLIKEYKEDEDD